MVYYILLALALLVVLLLILAMRQPNEFRIERSTVMAASPRTIFALVNDFHRWPEWSPWAKLDPNVQYKYDGPPAGEGSSCAWVGNSKAGQGRMTIIKSVHAELIILLLEFIKPFDANNTAEFTFTPVDHGTLVVWAMTGRTPFLFKLMYVFMSMDKMIGPDFDRGLANIKLLVEI